MTLHQLLNEGTRKLERAGDGEAALDARRLLLEAFRLDMVHFLMNRMESLEETRAVEEAAADYRQMIDKRCRRIPLQHILGTQDFMGFTFKVDRRVLIPRQDTETLVETVLEEQKDPAKKVLDLCTGSGCIAISLMAMGGYDHVTATDLSGEALKVAAANGEQILGAGHKIQWRQGDLFQALSGEERYLSDQGPRKAGYDIIVSNPPYIPTETIRGLEPEVRDHEPVMALDGDLDGLRFYKSIAGEAGKWLRPGGSIYLEIGHDQARAVTDLLREGGFVNIRVIKDAPGKDRVVRGDVDKNHYIIK
ncbi:MAG: peptide chain release factor N(5)-glutamine methyltransferase [Hungatella sp.]|jgi:release factor glutamine methyltransferase|nr:peptide chain release factor N(5)-glutamine methyltransferase [Hungatella sp.]